MKAYDLMYDGLRLSDKNFTLCQFGQNGVETISGAEINFNTVSTLNGQKHLLISSEFNEPLTSTFQICKNLCDYGGSEITIEEYRDITRWLNRNEFHKLKFIDADGEYANIWFEASFNISRIEIGGILVGFELECHTNRPHGFRDSVVVNIKNLQAGEVKTIYSQSDQEGCLYPDEMQITIEADGDFKMYNDMEPDREMKILNCKAGEVITLSYPLIFSSLGESRETKIQNDFNWIFFRIATQFKNRVNNIHTTLPCSIKMKYSPIIKVGI